MYLFRILIPKLGLFPLDYSSSKKHKIGELVVITLRGKEITGIIWEALEKTQAKKIKEVHSETPFSAQISNEMIQLIKKASDYYLTELGTIAKLVLPVDVNELPIKIREQNIDSVSRLPALSEEQNIALQEINKSEKPVIVKGVTGSGKSEVYFHAINEQLKKGNQALILLPEIALSGQIIERFKERFGFDGAIWNSKVTKVQKKRILRGIISGDVKIIIGARSALFLPYKKLGIIVVDEEHDASYKQDQGVLYHARDMAVLRGAIEKCKIVLASATPSIESLYNAKMEKYSIVELKSRYNDALLPEIKIIDMKKQSLARNCWLSDDVVKAIHKNLEKKQQTLIFLNKRGYAPLMMCKECDYRFNCTSCSASMVMHKSINRLECHHCNAILPVPNLCPSCDANDTLILCGPGIERIEEEARRYFPNAEISLASKDETSSADKIQELLNKMQSGEIDILIGTQVTTKGYHFPNLTLVVVVDVDSGFFGNDLRASERTFQLLQQAGGRAGRAEKKGSVLLQTYCKDHKVVKALASNNEDLFIQEEMKNRNLAEMPPFTKMASIIITGKKPDNTFLVAKNFVAMAPKSSARILGPAEAMILKKLGQYRYKILVVADKKFNLQKYIKLWRESCPITSSYHVKIDIDPHNFI